MSENSRFRLFFKLITQVKPGELFNMLVYRLGLISGFYKSITLKAPSPDNSLELDPAWIGHIQTIAANVKGSGFIAPIKEANEICNGRIRLFGNDPVKLDLNPGTNQPHWTQYELGKARPKVQDIKFTWEPARFGWAMVLARAYSLTGKSRYAANFWKNTETFLDANPAYFGPNWTSAQEAAMRIVALSFALPIFWNAKESTPERKQRILNSLSAHAFRIQPTLAYARAQNNNHLLLEGLGLFTAGMILANHSQSQKWKNKGWQIFNHTLQHQIEPGGEYCQHSLNYHRLMLQAALWADLLCRFGNLRFPIKTSELLKAATVWMSDYVDSKTGNVPNLGHNDGALLLHLSNADFSDYRPTLQAAEKAFLQLNSPKNTGQDEMSAWLVLSSQYKNNIKPLTSSEEVHSIATGAARAFMRIHDYKNRPAHADHLHVDLWHKEKPITLDAGTFQYNAPAPWDNGLAGTPFHNTVSIDGQDQMTRFSRFLWLDWGKSIVVESTKKSITAGHMGYEKLGYIHRRKLESISSSHWVVTDELITHRKPGKEHKITLNWNFPDGHWTFDPEFGALYLEDLNSKVIIKVGNNASCSPSFQIIRAGKLTFGKGKPSLLSGWYSPTYGKKVPALSFQVTFATSTSLEFQTIFLLGEK